MSKSVTTNLPTPRTVDFHGDPVVSMKVEDIIRVVMKPISEKLGLNWSKSLKKIKRDPVLNQVMDETSTTSTGTDGKTYQVKMITLPLDYLNGWLFKIDAGRYKEDDPRREVIIRYQRECYRVLHDYWHKGEVINPRSKICFSPIEYIPTELLTDKILEWVLAQTDPFDFTDVMRGTGASTGYAQDCLKKFSRLGLILKGNDKYYRLTEKALVMVKDKEKVRSIATIPTPAHPHSILDLGVPANVETRSPTVALAPCARAVDLGWKESSSGPHVEKLQWLHTRLTGKALYFFPISWMAEALDMPIDTIKGMLDPEKFEIFTDNGEVREWLSMEVNTYHLSFERDTFVTTFGLQRLMQVRAQKSRKTPSMTVVKDIFNAFLEIAKGTGMDWREAITKANAATLKVAGVDCLKLLE